MTFLEMISCCQGCREPGTAQWQEPGILALGRLGWENRFEFKDSLGHVVQLS